MEVGFNNIFMKNFFKIFEIKKINLKKRVKTSLDKYYQ